MRAALVILLYVRLVTSIITLGVVFSFTTQAAVKKPQATAKKPAVHNSDAFKHIACNKQVFETLYKWETPTNWQDEISDSAEGVHAMKSPTDKVGVWIKLVSGKDNTTLVRTTQDTAVEVRYKAPDCVPQLRTTSTDPKTANDKGPAFTDSDLQKTLDASKDKKTKGAFYVWSPRMNLSVTGAKEAMESAKKQKFDLTLLVDPEVPAAEIEKIEKAQSLPKSLRMRSSDLGERGILIHYPAMILYSNGQLLNKLRPGYDEPKRFDKYVKESLKL